MVGKKLLALLLDLTVSERRVLLNEAKKSKDKRHEALIVLLHSKVKDEGSFISALSSVSEILNNTKVSEAEKNLKIRRFVDFGIKQIEELKISTYLKSNAKLRNLVLSNVYDRQGTKEIMEGYLNNLGTVATKEKDLDLKNYYLSKSLEIRPQSQTVKSVESWRELLSERLELIESRYKADKAELFDLVSISYLDNGVDFSGLVENYKLSENVQNITIEVEQLGKVSYEIAEARVNFNNQEKSLERLEKAKSLVKSVESESAKKLELERRIAYVEFLSKFHHGSDSRELVSLIDKVVEIDNTLGKEDHKVLFYQAGLAAIDGVEHDSLSVLRTKVKDDSRYMVEFVDALLYLKKGELKKAKRLFHEVSYAGNPYVASWARVADIAINAEQGNDDLVRSLLQRANRQLENNEDRVFSLNSSALVQDEIARQLGIGVPAKRKGQINNVSKASAIHRAIYSIVQVNQGRLAS